MTEETQALVSALDAWSHDERLGDGMLLRKAAAALIALARDLETARQCPDCHQPLVCPAGTAERIAGLEAMHEETLTRAERAEAALDAAVRAARAETWAEAAEWVKGCREDDHDRPMVQVFDVMAKKLLERATAAREGQ